MANNLGKHALDILGFGDRPLPSSGQVLVIVGNVALDLLFEISDGEKVAPSQNMLIKDAKPNFNGVEPATMFWGIDEANAMRLITQIGLPTGHTFEDSLLAFDAQILLIPQHVSNQAHQCFALMGIELVAQNDEIGLRIGLNETFDMLSKVDFCSGIGNGGTDELTSGQVKVCSENLGSMPHIVELPTLHMACLHRQDLAIALERLDTGFLIDTDDMRPLIVLLLRAGVLLTDGGCLLCEALPIVDVGILPVAAPMRLELGFLLKKGSPETVRWWEQFPWRSLPL
jgi:hypothetical protein